MPGATVSVLFTDLVGSTELLSRVGAERGEELRREHFGALRTPLVDGGREVKNLGDGLMVVFESVTAALNCAIAMQQAIELRNRDSDVELAVRIGLSTGEADVDEDDYFGAPVVEAARLCARADGGEILVNDVVRLLAGSRGGFGFEPVGQLELKGLDEFGPHLPVELGAGLARRTGSTYRSSPGWRPPPTPPSWVAASSSNGSTRRASGPRPAPPSSCCSAASPGWASRRWPARSPAKSAATTSSCSTGAATRTSASRTSPGWRRSATWCAHAARTRCWPRTCRPATASSRPLAPGPGQSGGGALRPRPGDGEAERYLLFGAVVDLLERVAADQPVRAGPRRPALGRPSHAAAAAPRCAGPTWRCACWSSAPSAIPRWACDHPLADTLAASHRQPNGERLTLRGLDDVELLEMMEATAGHLVGDEGIALRDALLSETEGNPFFAGEILRHLAETGVIFRDPDGRWTTSGDLGSSALPVSVREVIMRRVARLGDDTRRVLSMASVIGRDFDVELLARVVEMDDDRLVDLLERATRAAADRRDGRAGAVHLRPRTGGAHPL